MIKITAIFSIKSGFKNVLHQTIFSSKNEKCRFHRITRLSRKNSVSHCFTLIVKQSRFNRTTR